MVVVEIVIVKNKNSTMIAKAAETIVHLVTIFVTFIAPMQTYLYVTVFNVMVDFFIGFYKAVVHDKKKLSREKLIDTLKSLIFFFMALMMGMVMETYLVPALPILLTIAISINIFYFFRGLKNISIITGIDIVKNVKKLFKKD
jgi:hypothetical protein